MSTFNFTVRATDDQDTYADRQFSINVKNDKMINCVVADGSNVYTTTNLGKDTMVTRPGVTTASLGSTMNTLTYGNGTWIASNGTSYYTSVDGINWVLHSYPDYTSTTFSQDTSYANNGNTYPLNNITFKNGYFFVVLRQEDKDATYFNYVLYSVDGINWKQFGTTWIRKANSTMPSNDFYFDGEDLFIAMSTNGYYRTTTDSSGNKIWSLVSVSSLSGTAMASAIGMVCINGLWLLYSSNTLFTSNDLVTWTTRSGFTGNTELKYVNGRVVSLLDNTNTNYNYFIYSQDCITWTSVKSTLSYTPNAGRACMYKGSFIMVASGGSVVSSSDGVTYTALTQGSTGWPFSGSNGIASIV